MERPRGRDRDPKASPLCPAPPALRTRPQAPGTRCSAFWMGGSL